MEQVEGEALKEDNVSDWADLTQAFVKMKDVFSKQLIADNVTSSPMPNLDELTWANAYQALRAQKAIKSRLVQEMQRVEAAISFLQMSCNKLALRRGLRLLPDEILAMVFESGYMSDRDSNKFVITVSHVNRRFRNISLRIPRLWSTVTNYQCASELEEFLVRSKDTGINVRLSEDLVEPNIPAELLIPIIIRHSQRWVEFDHGFDQNLATRSELSNYILDLPKLRKLTDYSTYLAPILAKWSMPSLADYEGELCPDFSATTLVSCTLNLWEGPKFDGLDGLLSFISNNPTLRSLSLIFHEFIPYMSRSQVDAKATLSSLETFSVHFAGGCYIDSNFERFMTNLNLPKITQLSLRLVSDPDYGAPEESDTGRLFRVLFPGLNPYPTLDKLDLITDAFYVIPSKQLEELLDRLPSLRHLYVEAPQLNPSADGWTERGPPPLHSVELSNCDRLTRGFVEAFVNVLLRNDHSDDDRMKTFTVFNCRGIHYLAFSDLEAKLGDRFVFIL